MARLVSILVAFWLCLLARPSLASPLREQDLIDFVGDQVSQSYQVERGRVEISWEGSSLETLLGRTLPDDGVLLKIEGRPRLLGKAVVPLAVEANGKRIRTIYPRMEIKVWQDVWVATQAIHRGSLFDSSMARPERRTLETLRGSAPKSVKGLQGALVKREIPSGGILVAEMFDMPPLVKSGKMVTVRLTSGELLIVTRGQVVGDGALGQLVRVVNPDTHRDYVARVSGPDQVEVNLEEAP